jgi:murein DD-endopeptidase MepM/ murein hydrolase activator NlpD
MKKAILILFSIFIASLPGYVLAQKKPPKKEIIAIKEAESIPVNDAPIDLKIKLDISGLDKAVEKLLMMELDLLRRVPSVASEDSAKWFDERSPVFLEITEQLKIDCLWVTSHEYYGVWDSKKLNPYEIDVTKFEDTVSISLYDTELNQYWASPLKSTRITSQFGFRRLRWHYGIDIGLTTGDSIYSAFDGIVRLREFERAGYGHYLVLRHANGLETLYGHLSRPLVQVGQEVKAGELIGLGGSTGRSTGPHLHFEVRYMGNAIDPNLIYDFNTGILLKKDFEINPAIFEYLSEVRKVIYHRVRSGESLSVISKRYGISIDAIARLNGITRNSVLRVGQQLRIK